MPAIARYRQRHQVKNAFLKLKRWRGIASPTYQPKSQARPEPLGLRAAAIVNKKRVERLAGLQGISRRRGWCATTRRERDAKVSADLVNRQFVADAPNQVWVADMTYLPTWVGFACLAVVVDIYSRKVIGWAFGAHMTADLVVQALETAAFTRKPESAIHHPDQGSQYGTPPISRTVER